MTIRPGKRVIDYTLGKVVTLGDIREIINETESISPVATFQIMPMGGQLDENYYRVVITEEWPSG